MVNPSAIALPAIPSVVNATKYVNAISDTRENGTGVSSVGEEDFIFNRNSDSIRTEQESLKDRGGVDMMASAFGDDNRKIEPSLFSSTYSNQPTTKLLTPTSSDNYDYDLNNGNEVLDSVSGNTQEATYVKELQQDAIQVKSNKRNMIDDQERIILSDKKVCLPTDMIKSKVANDSSQLKTNEDDDDDSLPDINIDADPDM